MTIVIINIYEVHNDCCSCSKLAAAGAAGCFFQSFNLSAVGAQAVHARDCDWTLGGGQLERNVADLTYHWRRNRGALAPPPPPLLVREHYLPGGK